MAQSRSSEYDNLPSNCFPGIIFFSLQAFLRLHVCVFQMTRTSPFESSSHKKFFIKSLKSQTNPGETKFLYIVRL